MVQWLFERPKPLAALLAEGRALRAQNRMDEARDVLLRALRVEPRSFDAHAELFEVQIARGDLAAAVESLRMLIEHRPEWTDAHYNLGVLLKKLARPEEAERAFRAALARQPAHRGALRALGGVLLAKGRVDEALAFYRGARAADAADFGLESAELFALSISEGVTQQALFERHADFGRRLEAAVAPLPAAPKSGRKRLRVGYLSPDFRYHVVTLFALPVIERHDRDRFEVFGYSTGDVDDEYTRRVAAACDHWRPAGAAADAALADAIRADGIDLLVDLAGHSGTPNLGVLARRPARVQATWLGYLTTTGLSRIDYKVSDSTIDPPGATERYNTERIARLPHSLWCYRPLMQSDPAPAPPCLRNGDVTFGAFNQTMKISGSTRQLWRRILEALPRARLLVLGVPPDVAAGLAADLACGEDRLRMLPYVSLADYHGAFASVDIALDTTPYSGATTTLDALWNGVPVVTLEGERSASRSAASLLRTLGLADWIAATDADYVGLAVRFAAEAEVLSGLRSTLRARLRASPLTDEAGFTRDLETLYLGMMRA
jgi:predicted O-linked N-acetylglucosamine transferase (SPINDLY family)